jgi:hypothetical protein
LKTPLPVPQRMNGYTRLFSCHEQGVSSSRNDASWPTHAFLHRWECRKQRPQFLPFLDGNDGFLMGMNRFPNVWPARGAVFTLLPSPPSNSPRIGFSK